MKQHFDRDFWQVIGSRLRFYRERDPNLTQMKMGEWIGVKGSFMGQLERGEKGTSVKNLLILAEKLNVPPVALLTTHERDNEDLEFIADVHEIRQAKDSKPELYTELKGMVKYLKSKI